MGDVRVVRTAGRSWPLLGFVVALGCGDDDARYTPEAFSLTAVRVPPLGCGKEVSMVGDCRHRGECGVGELCVRDRRHTPDDRSPVALTCGAPLGSSRARDRCEYGNACTTGLCALSGVCLDPCSSDLDCERGMQCRAVEARIDEGLSPVMACTRPLVLPASAQLAVSPRPFRLTPGSNEIVVPSATEPALMLVQGSCGAGLELLTLREGESRRVLYDQSALRKGQRATNTVLHDGSALAALLFPNNPSLTPGALRIGLRVDAPDLAEVVVASRTLAATALDLNVFYVGGGELWVEGGFRPGDPEVPAMLRRLDKRYRAVGLALGEIREYDVVGARREELSVLEVARREVDGREIEGRPKRLDELFALSAGVDDPGINVFIVSDMGGYVGIAGGIPGPIGVHGTERSGVALAIDVLGDLREADLVLMHELSHYMGLFHTTESGGTVLDPLDDTEECRIEHDEDGDHHVSAQECASLGADNLMFWSGAGARLTRQQIEVLASSVVLR
ncbi:MAG: hypothetical protein ABW252_05220 [Polyangiales bacterium]